MTTIGSLFSGYGGLDMGVQLALGTMRTAWVSDIEPGPQTILTRRYPHTPNLGDITSVDWGDVEPVDIITGGSPCQDLSMAGARAGMKPGTRSGLWESMTHAIDVIRPRLVVWENVRGATSAEAYSRMEPGAGHLGNRPNGLALRALGRVLGDLANLGYDASWHSVQAADVGAPHHRARVFVIAYPSDTGCEELRREPSALPEYTAAVPDKQLLPTPTVGDKGGAEARGGEGFGKPLREVARLLPTPDVHGDNRKSPGFGNNGANFHDSIKRDQWSDYAPAIHRWESIFGRSAPEPTEPSRTGKPQLSPRFVEWMMGLPAGWVTDVPISRAQQLRALGNGVVPQQAAYAITEMLAWQEAAA